MFGSEGCKCFPAEPTESGSHRDCLGRPRLTASPEPPHCTPRAEITWEAGGAWGGRARGRGYFSPCVSSSGELARAVYPHLCPTLPPQERAALTGDHALEVGPKDCGMGFFPSAGQKHGYQQCQKYLHVGENRHFSVFCKLFLSVMFPHHCTGLSLTVPFSKYCHVCLSESCHQLR